MQYKYYIADVFTEQAFSGAQIAVFPNADGLDPGQMQLIARELNLSETAFIFPPANDSNTRKVRIFNPNREIDFAGHPIIAIGHVLATNGDVVLNGADTSLIIEQKSGPVDVIITQANGQPVEIQFSLKSGSVFDKFVPTDTQIAEVLSLDESDIENIKFNSCMVYSEKPYLIVPMRSFEAVRKAKFNYNAWSQVMAPVCNAEEILLFSTRSDVESTNFHARLLGPNIGILEDPPIGSAIPAFSHYLCNRDTIGEGTHTYTIDRGTLESRKSTLNIEMDYEGKSDMTIRVGGPAVIVSEGNLILPD